MMSTNTSDLIKMITFRGVNCYLIKTKSGFILIDTGYSNQRSNIESALDNAGVQPGNLTLILLTHGDFDHVGNAKYFRDKYQSKIAMHEGDLGMVKLGKLFYSRESGNMIVRKLVQLILPVLRMNLKKNDRFTPDVYFNDGDDLSDYGFNAKVVNLPGHSKGSIAFLTAERNIYIGDLLENLKRGPVKGSLIDDSLEHGASIDKLTKLSINTIYPGHGKPFLMQEFMENC